MSSRRVSGLEKAFALVWVLGILTMVVSFVIIGTGDETLGFTVLFVGIGVMAVGTLAGGVIRSKREKEHKQSVTETAQMLGFEQGAIDPFDLHELGFYIFDKSRESKKTLGYEQTPGSSHDVLWGRWDDLDVKVFTYSYTSRSYNSSDQTWNSTTIEYRCCVTDLPAQFPKTSIGREGFFSRVAGALGGGDVKTGRADFDRTFRIKSDDESFVKRLVDEDMAAWLRTLSEDRRFEIAGSKVMCFTSDTYADPAELVGITTEFARRVPREAVEAYPQAGGGSKES